MYIAPNSDRLPGEPLRVRAASLPFALRTLAKVLSVTILAVLTAPLWLPFALGRRAWGWPPHQPRGSEVRRYLRRTVRARPPAPGLAPLSRVWLALVILEKFAWVPVHGLAWYLDELIYGDQLRASPVVAPLITLSAARSGSTQSARYLEQDPRLGAPTVLQTLFPYVWVWRLASRTLGRWLEPDQVRELMRKRLTQEFEQRHEGDPFRTDTLEVLFFIRRLQMLSPALGPEAMIEELSVTNSAPYSRQFWTEDFVNFVDRLGRKTLFAAGPGPSGHARRLFIKGHFLPARDALARRYPEAHFLTVIRDPATRLRSHLNHLHGNPFEETLGAVPWTWIAAFVVVVEVEYGEIEQRWFSAPDGPARTVVCFADFVEDLEGTMTHIYRECMGDTSLPPHVPTEHSPRERTNYLVNRRLDQAGIDPQLLADKVRGYSDWIDATRTNKR